MVKIKLNSTLITTSILSLLLMNGALAEVTPQQQEVLDDYLMMKDMSIEERREYRQRIFADKSPEQNKAYTKAFKLVRPMLPDYLGLVNGQDPAKANKTGAINENKPVKAVTRIAGTNIQYDTGTVTGGAGIASQMLGNRFDSALNPAGTMCCFPVESSGSITMVTFNMVNTFFSSAVFSLYSNIMGTTAVQVTSMARAGIMTGLNTLAVASPTSMNAYANGTFLAGIWQFDPTMTGLAVDAGSIGGQGFHAISLNDGAAASMLTSVTSAGMGINAIFRVRGNVATPVELINFTVE